MTNIAFIDLEASGLRANSWPIEVGWCFEGGKPQTFLIKPDGDWSLDAWDPAAETLHGISIDYLNKKGHTPKDVCAKLNAALDGVLVYSDAPDWDGYWLYRLFNAGGSKQAFRLTEFDMLFAALPPEKVSAAIARANEIAPHCHRAREDVLHMQAIYEHAAAKTGR